MLSCTKAPLSPILIQMSVGHSQDYPRPSHVVAECTEQRWDLASQRDVSQTLTLLIRSSLEACARRWLQTHCCFHQCSSCCSADSVFPSHTGTRCCQTTGACTAKHCANADSAWQQKTRFAMQIVDWRAVLGLQSLGGNTAGITVRCQSPAASLFTEFWSLKVFWTCWVNTLIRLWISTDISCFWTPRTPATWRTLLISPFTFLLCHFANNRKNKNAIMWVSTPSRSSQPLMAVNQQRQWIAELGNDH